MATALGHHEDTCALAALVLLATSERPLSLRRMALDAPVRSFARTMARLERAGIVRRSPEARTTFTLARAPFLVSVADVLAALHPAPPEPRSSALAQGFSRLARVLDETSVADLAGIPAPRRFPTRAVHAAIPAEPGAAAAR